MPAEGIVIGLLVAPGEIVPVLKLPLSAVAVWAVLSAFLQATVWPALTDPALGENELLPFMPVMVIVTSAVIVVAAGVLGDVGLVPIEPPPQLHIAAAATTASAAPPKNENLMAVLLQLKAATHKSSAHERPTRQRELALHRPMCAAGFPSAKGTYENRPPSLEACHQMRTRPIRFHIGTIREMFKLLPNRGRTLRRAQLKVSRESA